MWGADVSGAPGRAPSPRMVPLGHLGWVKGLGLCSSEPRGMRQPQGTGGEEQEPAPAGWVLEMLEAHLGWRWSCRQPLPPGLE